MCKTLRFEIVSGVNKGYFNGRGINLLDDVSILWQKIAAKEFELSGVYVSAVIKNSKTVYHENWGCPKGGEYTVVITGVANKEFIDDLKKWKNIVLRLAKLLKEGLNQSTLTCEFLDTELHYFK